ncbi:transcriptional regulator [Paenibacillus sp. CAA11]|uniref:helix-turn-helix domain-containing protein n=1 Tax=Paenibacillus sp. CAA11 TaxID=1532905 RepID=UPI000D37526B|nr:helix-turn-helix transcriptional regulator [Paenibacillus sp. CAA11]AWB43720.1 transcriptional regulator [Paenibacillus sp. CAA11]
MLKERIDYLCKKKNITRKELVEGLVTPAHFANILADRYPLAEDLAERIAKRLGVTPEYLLNTASCREEVLQRADQIFNQLADGASSIAESEVHALPDRDDALVVELTTALMKAIYYQQLNDRTAYDYLHTSYLNYYLDKYGRPDEIDLPLPLQKALLLYKVQYFRSKHMYFDVQIHVTRLHSLLPPGTEVWLTVQNLRMEAYIYIKEYEQAKQVFEDTMKLVYENRLFHRLSGLYVAYSGYCYTMGLTQEALSALAMAEANLVYAQRQGDLLTAIMNNRIVMLTLMGELDQALEEIARFESMVDREAEEVSEMLRPVTQLYRCEVAFMRKDWVELLQRVEQLKQDVLTTDQRMACTFYKSQLALSQGDTVSFTQHALECLPYFEDTQQAIRLEQLYETLAMVSEDQRKYKESSSYYRKLVYLLRKK